jgi:diguanylate cyclase (GGDEF)-like protein
MKGAMESASISSSPLDARTPTWRTAALQLGAFALAGVVIALTADLYRWDLVTMAVITAFTVLSELTSIDTGHRLRVSGAGLGLSLAVVLLGGGPAAVVGVVSVALGWFTSREAPHQFRNNLAAFAWFPLIAGLFFRAALHVANIHGHGLGFFLLVFVAYLVSITANFLFIAGYACYLRRIPPATMIRDSFVPLLAAQLFSALLAMAAAYFAIQLGTVGIAMLGVTFVIFQYLVGELLKSKQRSEELQRVATTDELTGLANRERYREVVEERIAAAGAARAGGFAVMLLDLDRFKEINDTLGHHYGDVLLRDLGPRLVEAVGPGGLVARLGGDEFAVLPAPDCQDVAALERVALRLTECVNSPFAVDELSLEVGASIGIARYPDDGEDSHALLRCADIAMYTAKEAQCDFKVYTAEQNQHSVRRLSVLADIRHALASDQIVVHYQPIVDLDDLSVRGAEGLVRWNHPEQGLIPPGAFVQTVEQTGLIGPLTRHVLERAIAECAAWRRDGRDLSVAVNLSVRNLLDRDLPKEIERLLDRYSLPADALQLEITESMIMSDPERSLATVTRLSNLGARMSVDDFGTGYSSLANLRRMPIDELKIDRSFVSPMLRDESDLIIVRSTINLGHDLGLRIIAEGVEDGATLERLALLGCDLAQGFHLSRPMPPDAFNAWLQHAAPHPAPPGPAAVASNGGGPSTVGAALLDPPPVVDDDPRRTALVTPAV